MHMTYSFLSFSNIVVVIESSNTASACCCLYVYTNGLYAVESQSSIQNRWLANDASDLAWNRLLTQVAQAASSGRAARAVQNVKICFAFTGLCRYAIQRKLIGRLGNSTLNFTRKIDSRWVRYRFFSWNSTWNSVINQWIYLYKHNTVISIYTMEVLAEQAT
jgi:hypothetical protein